ncbi:MAG: hypothetical protein ACO1OB_27345 [Archangium sp.]
MRSMLLALLFSTIASAEVVDFDKKEITLKFTYCSVGDGAFTNLEYLYAKTSKDADTAQKVKQLQDDRKAGRPLRGYDFLPLSLGEIRGFKVRVNVAGYTSNGAIATLRKEALEKADGIVFVASAAPSAQNENVKQFAQLKKDVGPRFEKLALALQLDADGVKDPVTIEAVRKSLGLPDTTPSFVATPLEGPGVFDTLKAVTRQAVLSLRDRK